jgi:hypothetical protein
MCTLGTGQPEEVAQHVISTFASPTLHQACIEQASGTGSRRYNPKLIAKMDSLLDVLSVFVIYVII